MDQTPSEWKSVAADPQRERLGLWAVVTLIFVFSWPSVIPQILASWRGVAAVPSWARLLQILLIAPGVVAVAAAAINGGWQEAKRLLKRLLKWRAAPWLYLAALGGPPLVIGLSVWMSAALGQADLGRMTLTRLVAAFPPTFLVYLLLNTEELAWRGYVLPRMQARWSPLAASLVIGAVWGVFHAPYFFMKGGHPGGFTPLLFALSVIPLAVILTGIFNASGGSVLLPHLFHQSVNAWAEAFPYVPRFSGSRWPISLTAAALVAITAAMVASSRSWVAPPRRLSRQAAGL